LPEGDIEVGTLRDASAAVARLLSVTRAGVEAIRPGQKKPPELAALIAAEQ
jgi:hypothetical protein